MLPMVYAELVPQMNFLVHIQELDEDFNIDFWQEDQYLRYNIYRLSGLVKYAHAICIANNTEAILERNPNKFQTNYWLKKNSRDWAWNKLDMQGWCDNTNGYGYANTNIQKAESRWRLSNLINTPIKVYIGRGTAIFNVEEIDVDYFIDQTSGTHVFDTHNKTRADKMIRLALQ